jgi:ribosomal protein L22
MSDARLNPGSPERHVEAMRCDAMDGVSLGRALQLLSASATREASLEQTSQQHTRNEFRVAQHVSPEQAARLMQ